MMTAISSSELSRKVNILAFEGKWSPLLQIVERSPELINSASEKNGYTPLHQAAWHGVERSILGQLLKFGADKSLATYNKHQTPWDIAAEKHASRKDLLFLLHPQPRTLAQLMRKMIEDHHIYFESYDENMKLYEKMLFLFNDDGLYDSMPNSTQQFTSAFLALTGTALVETITEAHDAERVNSRLDLRYWQHQFMPALQKLAARKNSIPLEKSWITVADLMFPERENWGYRGDPFLWQEMRQALARVPVPDNQDDLQQILLNSAQSLINASFSAENGVFVNRFSHGGMSSGWVSFEFWTRDIIPELLQRAEWVRDTWR